jgi:methylmalonyl-CoA mutase cobalamin-binding subunit
MTPNMSDQPTLSIGALSQATGIPKETIRTWERRYGFPDPARNDVGHRIYAVDTVTRLRLVSEAIDAGHRPSNVVGEDAETLRALLRTSRGEPSPSAPLEPREPLEPAQPSSSGVDPLSPSSADEWLEDWLEAAAHFDGDSLGNHLYQAWNQFGGLRFLEERIGPFLNAIGEAWSQGRIGVSHEHFVSEHLRDFLTRQWRPLSERARGPKVVLANLPGEYHCLGLHMAAVIISLGGCELSFLGTNTPLEDIIAAADQQDSAAVIVSVSRAYDQQQARGMLTALKASMERDVHLIVGGAGRPSAEGAEIHMDRWEELYDWSRKLASAQS